MRADEPRRGFRTSRFDRSDGMKAEAGGEDADDIA